jgi:hypothetical protein
MQKKNSASWFLVGVLALVSVPAMAADTLPGEQPTAQAQEARLASAYHTLASSEASMKLGAVKQSEVMRQRVEIKDLIRRLEAGEQVAPSEVDRVLRAH